MPPGNDAERLARRIASGDRSPGTAAAYASSVGAAEAQSIAGVWIAQMDAHGLGWIGIGATEREARGALRRRWAEYVDDLMFVDHSGRLVDKREADGRYVARNLEELDSLYGVVTSRYTLGKGYLEKEEDDDELDRRMREEAKRRRRREGP